MDAWCSLTAANENGGGNMPCISQSVGSLPALVDHTADRGDASSRTGLRAVQTMTSCTHGVIWVVPAEACLGPVLAVLGNERLLKLLILGGPAVHCQSQADACRSR